MSTKKVINSVLGKGEWVIYQNYYTQTAYSTYIIYSKKNF